MNSEKAKEILIRYRPGLDEAQEPEVREALACAQEDAALSQGLARQQHLSNLVRQKLRAIEPPPGLRERILAQAGANRKVIPWQQTTLLALAAVLVLSLCLLALWRLPSQEDGLAAYRQRMAKTALRDYRMDLVSRDLAQIRNFVAKRSPHGDFALTPPLTKLPGAGCALLTWQNRPVSLLCFNRTQEDLLWLFIIDRSDLKNAFVTSEPRLQPVGKLMTATWSQGDKIYLMAVVGDEALLRKYL